MIKWSDIEQECGPYKELGQGAEQAEGEGMYPLKSGLDLVDVMSASIGPEAAPQRQIDWLRWLIDEAEELAYDTQDEMEQEAS